MKRPGGVTAVAIWYLVTGALALISFCVLVTLPVFGFLSDIFDEFGLFALATAGLCVALFLLLDAILALIAGYGLLKMREWGRFLGIFLAFFTLLAFPFGTILGAVILWYLFQGEVKEAFALEADPYRADYQPDMEALPEDEKDFQYYAPHDHSEETPAPPPDPVTGEDVAPDEPSGDAPAGDS